MKLKIGTTKPLLDNNYGSYKGSMDEGPEGVGPIVGNKRGSPRTGSSNAGLSGDL